MLIAGTAFAADTRLRQIIRSERGLCHWALCCLITLWQWQNIDTNAHSTRRIRTGFVKSCLHYFDLLLDLFDNKNSSILADLEALGACKPPPKCFALLYCHQAHNNKDKRDLCRGRRCTRP